MNIITREEALQKGLTRYYTGVPCIHGHNAERFACQKYCVACYKNRNHKPHQTKYRKVHTYDARSGVLQRKYGITRQAYNEMLLCQHNACIICRNPFVGTGNTAAAPCVDHCHLTNEIRGILCGRCNKMLGHAQDNITILENAIKYLNIFKDV
jgi:hypothetical protein